MTLPKGRAAGKPCSKAGAPPPLLAGVFFAAARDPREMTNDPSHSAVTNLQTHPSYPSASLFFSVSCQERDSNFTGEGKTRRPGSWSRVTEGHRPQALTPGQRSVCRYFTRASTPPPGGMRTEPGFHKQDVSGQSSTVGAAVARRSHRAAVPELLTDGNPATKPPGPVGTSGQPCHSTTAVQLTHRHLEAKLGELRERKAPLHCESLCPLPVFTGRDR